MTHPAIEIRPGQLDDVPAEAGLHRDTDWCFDEANTLAEYHDDAYEPTSVIIAEIDDEVVGKLELFVGWKSNHGHFGLIRRFVVADGWRGQVIGRVLLDAATERATEFGCTFLELSVDVTNPRAHAFYAGDGFVEDRVEVLMRKTLNDQSHDSNYRDIGDDL